MVIDISNFMIISQENFNILLFKFGCVLTPQKDIYFISYLCANLTAYLLIFAFIKLILTLYYMFFKKSDRYWLWIFYSL